MSNWRREETLDGACKYSCPKCQRPTRALKKLEMSNSPPVLVIHLKRFQHIKGKLSKKINEVIRYDKELILKATDKLEDREMLSTYKLKSIVSHSGKVSQGHYMATTRLEPDKDRWYCYSDSSRIPLSWKEVQKKQAYVLFYERSNTREVENGGTAHSHSNPLLHEIDKLAGREKLREYENDQVYLRCTVRKEAQRLSYPNLQNIAKIRCKLLGGTSSKTKPIADEQNLSNGKTGKKRDRNTSVSQVHSSAEAVPSLSIEKKTDTAPEPKRRKGDGMRLD